jgi:alpha-D-ribose 1-methylphosphonate 5-triphosphate synthase subunit PhnH
MIDATILQSPAQAAHAFRVILASFSKPAVPVSIASAEDAPFPLFPAAATVLLTLADYQTPIWLSPELNQDAVRKYLRFHTGAPITSDTKNAAFAVLSSVETKTKIPDFNLGSHEYPDRSTTIVVQVPSFSTGDVIGVSGPGLNHPIKLMVDEAPRHLWQHIHNNNSLFPIGNDFILSSASQIVTLPRSSHITLAEAA